jgi:uncharacterized membrane protein
MLKREETIELNMSVDEALKYIVSMGVVAPPPSVNKAAGPATSATPEVTNH